MRLAAIRHGNRRRAAIVDGESVFLLPPHAGTVEEIVAQGVEGLAGLARLVDQAERVPLDPGQLDAPLRRFPRDILCSGWNYWEHFEESRGRRAGQDPTERPRHPTFFTKGPHVVVGPHDGIALDLRLSTQWDYEAEVAVVIGRRGRSIPAERAWTHVFGLCIANDVSQRDLQRAHGGQWLKGKSIDATMPLGPWITTVDEIGDPAALVIECELNGEPMQSASTAQMAFSIAQLIAELSYGMTLEAGDLLLTGTPSGVGNARTPPVFLADGDTLRTRVSRLGELVNRVRTTDLTAYVAAGAAAGAAAA